MKRAYLASTLAIALLPVLAFAKGPQPSTLVFVGSENLRVTVDGVNYGTYTSKRVEVESVAPGNHRIVVKAVNPKFVRAKTVFNGAYDVPAGVQLSLEPKNGRLNQISMTELPVAAKQPDAPAAPTQSFGDGPSVVHIQSGKMMALIKVDGKMVPVDENACADGPHACDVYDVVPGPHDFEVRSGLTARKVLYKGRVEIPGGAEVFAKVGPGTFEIYNTTPRRDPQGVVVAAVADGSSTTTTTVTSTTVGAPAGVSAGMTVVDPDTGEQVSVQAGIGGVGAAGSVTVTETTTTVSETHSGGGAATVSGVGSLELTSTDGESFTVFIDGKERGTCNCLDGQSIRVKRVAAGEHKLVIKDFMGDEVWASGRVWVEPDFELKLGVSEQGVEAFNRSDAWIRGY